MKLCLAALLLTSFIALPARGQSGYAEPPPGFPGDTRDSEPPATIVDPSQASTFRLSVGPALRVSEIAPQGGFAAALDIGARAAGARLSGSWLDVGGEHGLSQYDLQLWIDFGYGRLLHPVLAAGAGIARADAVDADGNVTTSTLGVGVLRGTLEYVLPVSEADARAGIDVTGSVPAIRSRDAVDTNGWLLVIARVGVGF